MSNAKDLEKLVEMTLNHYGRVDDAVNSFGDSPRPEAIAPIFCKICVKGQSSQDATSGEENKPAKLVIETPKAIPPAQRAESLLGFRLFPRPLT